MSERGREGGRVSSKKGISTQQESLFWETENFIRISSRSEARGEGWKEDPAE